MISRARLNGMRVELFELMSARGKAETAEHAEYNRRIQALLPRINSLAAKLNDC
jgi:hypothetical protein